MECMLWHEDLGFFCSSFPIISRKLRGGNLSEKITAIKNKVFLANLEYEVWEKPLRKTKGEF